MTYVTQSDYISTKMVGGYMELLTSIKVSIKLA